MSRTATTAFDAQTAATREFSVDALDIAENYAILERDLKNGQTTLNNVSGDPSLQEFITYGYTPVKEVAVHPKMKPVYEPTTKDGYQVIIKDEWYQRITENDGTVHDDPVVAYMVFRTTRGSMFPDGDDVQTAFNRLLSAAYSLGKSTDALDTVMVDRLIHGATIPSEVR